MSTVREQISEAIRSGRSDAIAQAVDRWLEGTVTNDEIALNLKVEKANSDPAGSVLTAVKSATTAPAMADNEDLSRRGGKAS